MESNSSGYNPNIHHRRSIRLKGYDYSKAGMYFITICCQNRICRFGKIVRTRNSNNSSGPEQMIIQSDIATMKLNDAGKMVDEQWLAMVNRFPNIELHEYKIMPNHFHCILEIVGVPLVGTQFNDAETTIGRPQGCAPTDPQNDGDKPKNKTIGDMMDACKSIVTVEYIHGVKNKGWDRFNGKLLQRDYYEHIIRNEQEYLRISEYIVNNPSKWKEDKFYSE